MGGKFTRPFFIKENFMATYQEIRTQHINGNPPNTDPQRSTETFEQYKNRMGLSGLPPDINVGETDENYLIRLATYNPSPIIIKDAVYGVNVVGTVTSATSAASANTASYISSSAKFDSGKTYNLSASYAP